MEVSLPVVAGTVSTAIFAGSMLPMLVKACRTKDLSSYSLGNIALANLGNAVHSIYVFHLPAGPVWVLHSFYLVSTVLMLIWYLRYELAGVHRTAHVDEPLKVRLSAEATAVPADLASVTADDREPRSQPWTPPLQVRRISRRAAHSASTPSSSAAGRPGSPWATT